MYAKKNEICIGGDSTLEDIDNTRRTMFSLLKLVVK